jgi:hypothetical protein
MRKTLETTDGGRPSDHRHAPNAQQIAAAVVFVVTWLSFVAFITLYRAPFPSDAFAALTFELAGRAPTAVPQ